MISLNDTTQKIQVVLAAPISTVQPAVTIVTSDMVEGRSLRRSKTTATNSTTAVDVVTGVSGGLYVLAMSVFNGDNAAVTTTVQLIDNGTTRVLTTVTLQTGEALYWNELRGWYCVDVNGNQKSNAPASSGASSTADSKAVQASSQASSVLTNTATPGSSQASSIAALSPASTSSQASSVAALVPASTSSQASSMAAIYATISSVASRTKSSFSW